MRTQVIFMAAWVGTLMGCAGNQGNVRLTRPPSAKPIPVDIAVYPLLTTEPKGHVDIRAFGAEMKMDANRVYIQPPAETELLVTLNSQHMSDQLSAELASHGFALKQLPVETPEDESEPGAADKTFFVSLELLNHLRLEYGLKAVLMGNVYFAAALYAPGAPRVTAAYLKLVDIETLDVLCHVSLAHDDYGEEIEIAVREIAAQLANTAGLLPSPR